MSLKNYSKKEIIQAIEDCGETLTIEILEILKKQEMELPRLYITFAYDDKRMSSLIKAKNIEEANDKNVLADFVAGYITKKDINKISELI